MVNSILTENNQCNECFLLLSTVPCETDMHDKIQILNGNNETIFKAHTAIADCIPTHAKTSKGFGGTNCRRVKGIHEYCQKAKTVVGSALPYWDPESSIFIYNQVTKPNFLEKPTLDSLGTSLENIRDMLYLTTSPKLQCPKLAVV